MGAIVILAAVAWWSSRELRPCERLDRWLERSGCVAVHHVPGFVGNEALRSFPAIAFAPDGKHLSMVGTEVQRSGQSEDDKQPPPQRTALVTIDATSGAVTYHTADGPYLRGGLVGTLGVSWTGRYAAGVFFEPGWRGSASEDDGTLPKGRVRLWRLDGLPGGWESPVMELPRTQGMIFSLDEAAVEAAGLWWDVQTGKRLESRDQEAWGRRWGAREVASADGTVKAAWDGKAGQVTLSDARSGKVLRALPGDLGPEADVIGPWFHFSPSGKRLSMIATVRGSDDAALRVWDIGSGSRLLNLASPLLRTRSAWSPDERVLAVEATGDSREEGGGVALFRLP